MKNNAYSDEIRSFIYSIDIIQNKIHFSRFKKSSGRDKQKSPNMLCIFIDEMKGDMSILKHMIKY